MPRDPYAGNGLRIGWAARGLVSRLRGLSGAVFERLATIQTVMHGDAFIVAGFAPAVGEQMLAEVIDRNDLNPDDFPRVVFWIGEGHRTFLLIGSGNARAVSV
jgi:hypothetical protein